MTQNNDESYFNINQIAKLVGVVPTTLRNWEKKGLFIPKRASNGYRIFTLRDVDILKQVHELSRKSVDPKTIRSLVDKLRQQARNEPILDKSELGSKWRNHRLNRNYSIEQVAAETGISASYIHKIENAQVKNVSFDILHKLALFYGENIFDTQTERLKKNHFLVRKADWEPINVGTEGVKLVSLIGCEKHFLTPIISMVEPGCGYTDPYLHQGEEIIYLIKGNVKFTLNDESFLLSAGDSIHFQSTISHSWVNIGRKTAVMLCVHTSHDVKTLGDESIKIAESEPKE